MGLKFITRIIFITKLNWKLKPTQSCSNLPRLPLQYTPSSVYIFNFNGKYTPWKKNFHPTNMIGFSGFSNFLNIYYFLSPGFLVLRLYTTHNLNPYRTAVPITKSSSDDVQWQLLKRWQSFPSAHDLLTGRQKMNINWIFVNIALALTWQIICPDIETK